MKICFTSDLHGSTPLYAQLLDVIQREEPDILLLGGDQCPTEFGGNAIANQQHWLATDFHRFLESASAICKIIWTSGNHDLAGALGVLNDFQQDGLIIQNDFRWTTLGEDWVVFGFPYGPVSTGWIYKDWERIDSKQPTKASGGGASYTTLNGKVEEIHTDHFIQSQPSLKELLQESHPPFDVKKFLLLSHYPPYKSKLDESVNGPIGSRAISGYLDRGCFEIACFGHVHESPYLTGQWMHQCGESICVNPGQWGEKLHAVLFNTHDLNNSLTHTIFGQVNNAVPRISRSFIRQEQRKKWESRETPNMPLERGFFRRLAERFGKIGEG